MRKQAVQKNGLLILLKAAILAFLPVLCAAATEPETYLIGNLGGLLERDPRTAYRPFTSYLESRIPGARFEIDAYADIEDLLRAIGSKKIDFALVTPAVYVALDTNYSLRAIASVTQIIDGKPYPWMAGAAFSLDSREDLQTLGDSRGQRVVAVSPLALGSWLSVLREWTGMGIEPEEDFASLEYLFSFDEVVDRVCNGQADIGLLSASMLEARLGDCERPLRLLPHPSLDPDTRYPVPVSTRVYPEVAFGVINTDLDEELLIALTVALLELETGGAAASAIRVAGFTAPLSYQSVLGLMQELRLPPFDDVGQFTFIEFLRQHSFQVSLVLLVFMGLLGIAFARSQILNRRLSQSEQYRRLVFEKSNLPVAILSRDTLRFLDVNEAAARVYGRSREELIGSTSLDVSAPRQKDGVESEQRVGEVIKLLKSEQPLSFEWLHQRPGGETWEAEVHIMPFHFDDIDLLQITLVDVTERNRSRDEREKMQLQLQHSQRLESLGRLSGAIAHDFNNLLTVINGYTELLLMKMDAKHESYRTVMEIAQAGWRARELTNQLLTFGRRRIASVKAIDVNALIMNSGTMFRSVLGENIELETGLQPDLGLTLADPGQLHQVLINMLVNARDAMPEGGKVELDTAQVTLDLNQASALGLAAGDYVRITVSDNGCGISEEHQRHIFEPFFTTKDEKGSGIGLATAYGIVRQCEGAISFSSKLGQGTTFTIYLPVTDRQLSEAEVPETAGSNLQASRDFTVLVAEDQPDVRAYACSVLRSAGYKVLEAENGRSALELLEQQGGAVDLLFTDIVMPEMNGRELAEQVAARWPAIKLLFTSGYTDDEIALHGITQEEVDFISKPYVPQHLLNMLRSLLV